MSKNELKRLLKELRKINKKVLVSYNHSKKPTKLTPDKHYFKVGGTIWFI